MRFHSAAGHVPFPITYGNPSGATRLVCSANISMPSYLDVRIGKSAKVPVIIALRLPFTCSTGPETASTQLRQVASRPAKYRSRHCKAASISNMALSVVVVSVFVSGTRLGSSSLGCSLGRVCQRTSQPSCRDRSMITKCFLPTATSLVAASVSSSRGSVT